MIGSVLGALGRMQVQSLALHSGLRIQCCSSFGLGRDCVSDLIPCPGTPCAAGQSKMGEKKKKERLIYLFVKTGTKFIVRNIVQHVGEHMEN